MVLDSSSHFTANRTVHALMLAQRNLEDVSTRQFMLRKYFSGPHQLNKPSLKLLIVGMAHNLIVNAQMAVLRCNAARKLRISTCYTEDAHQLLAPVHEKVN